MNGFNPVIVVPVFNHGAAFAALLPNLLRHELPLIVVDDGSRRESTEILRRLQQSQPLVDLHRHPTNAGKGAAVTTGIRLAAARGFTHALQIDADGQHDVDDIPRLLESARQAPQAVIVGVPQFDASVPRVRKLGRYLTHVWVWVETLSLDITDSMCGFRVYPVSRVLPILDSRCLGRHMDFDSEILVRLHWQNTPIVSVPTQVTYPELGVSNFRMVKDNVRITAMHVRLVLGMLLRLPKLVMYRLKGSRAG
jgi:glycosyltransferase involved in cell wall biosynthesis